MLPNLEVENPVSGQCQCYSSGYLIVLFFSASGIFIRTMKYQRGSLNIFCLYNKAGNQRKAYSISHCSAGEEALW